MADETNKMKMEILRDCFVSEKSPIVRDGQPSLRRKVFKGEVHELHQDDAYALDEAGLAKMALDKPKKVIDVKANTKNIT